MNVYAEQNQSKRHGEQISGYSRERKGLVQIRGMELKYKKSYV